jgi:hypothetical protein
MAPRFEIVSLSGEQALRALPVVQATWPLVDRAAWATFAAAYEEPMPASAAPPPAPRSGLLGLADDAGTLCGVLAYRCAPELRGGLTLAVALFTAIDLANSPRTVRALLDAAETRAYELACARVEIRLHPEQAELAGRLRETGLVPHAAVAAVPLLCFDIAKVRAMS